MILNRERACLQVITWLIIPILQNYCLSGAFTVLGRLIDAIKELWRFYVIIGLVSVVGIMIAAFLDKLKLSTLPQLVITLSNAYGLLVIVGLLGYGLVEVPRVLWRRSFPETRLLWHWHRVGRVSIRLQKATNELLRSLSAMKATSRQVSPSNRLLKTKVEALIAYVNVASPLRFEDDNVSDMDIETLSEDELEYARDIDGLSRLHRRLKMSFANYTSTKGEFISFLHKSIILEDICRVRERGFSMGNGIRLHAFSNAYLCFLKPLIQRCSAILMAFLSLTIIWSEATIALGRDPDLSPVSLLVHSPSVISTPWLLQCVVGLTLSYVVVAAYSSLFRLSGMGVYHMVLHATSSWSLLLNGSLFARFAAPLAFNFLHVIRMADWNKNGNQMAFVRLMGMQDVPLFGTGFNTWFPIVMVVYTALLAFNWYESCFAKKLIPASLRFDSEKCDDMHTARGRYIASLERSASQEGRALGERICLLQSGVEADNMGSFDTNMWHFLSSGKNGAKNSEMAYQTNSLSAPASSSTNIRHEMHGHAPRSSTFDESDPADLLFSRLNGRRFS